MTIYEVNREVVIPSFHAGDRLAKSREVVEITQDELAQGLGVSRATISRWERGIGVKRSTMLLYAMRTGVPFEWIETGKCTPRDLNPEPTDYSSAAYDHPVVLLLAS
jgi:transcriptional regulator with XRE-family HTH domain